MCRKTRFVLAAAVGAIAIPASALAQINLTGVNPVISENFDSLGPGPSSTLPAGWLADIVNKATTYGSGTAALSRSAGVAPGSSQLNSNSAAGTYNLSSTTAANGTDRAVGWLTGSQYTGPRNLFVGFNNTTGLPISSVSLQFDIETYRGGTHDNAIDLFYGFDGSTWTSASATTIVNTGSTTTLYSPPNSTTVAVTLSNLSIPTGGSFYLQFQYTSPSGNYNTPEVLGIDNFAMTATNQTISSASAVNWNPLQSAGGSDGSGAWDAATSTWWSASAHQNAPWSDALPNAAVFGAGGSGSAAVMLTGPRTAASVTFNAASPNYTLNGASLTVVSGITANESAAIDSDVVFTGASTLSVAAGATLTFAGNLTSTAGVTKTGAGALTIARANVAGLNVSAGSLTVAHSAATPIMTSSLSIGDDTTATAARMDLDNNDLIVTYSASSPAGVVRALLIAGYNGGAWNGNGLASSSAHSDASQIHALGYADAADVGLARDEGTSITGQAVVVKYTTYGDSSLDGKVDLGNDFNLFLQGFIGANAASWELGDYNYDGIVNLTDFRLFIDGFASQNGSLGELSDIIAETSQLTSAQKSVLLTMIPEPRGIVIDILGIGVALMSRRSRSSKRQRPSIPFPPMALLQ